MRISRTRATAVAAAVVALGVAAPAGAQTLSGTVVHHNRHAHSFVVAAKGGELRAVHAHKLPAVGRDVHVDARSLRNGTFAAQHVKAAGHRGHTLLHGTISFADRRHGRLVLSSNGVSLLMRLAHGHGRRHTLPAVGTAVDVKAVLPAGGMPIAQAVTPVGTAFTVVVEGKLLAVDPTARTLSISADDEDRSGAQLTINVPDAIDLTTLTLGGEVELLVTLNADGTYTLAGLAGDDNGNEADDAQHEQGQSCSGDHHDDGDRHEDGGDTQPPTPSGDGSED
jgi:hypothetical protein